MKSRIQQTQRFDTDFDPFFDNLDAMKFRDKGTFFEIINGTAPK